METFFVFLDESRCYRQKRDLTADFRFIGACHQLRLFFRQRALLFSSKMYAIVPNFHNFRGEKAIDDTP